MSTLTNNDITPLNVKELLINDKYTIPVYQRNYAWKAKEIEQLIIDIIDYNKYNQNRIPQKNYYLGTLVVAKDKKSHVNFQTIDGQQRLTTLFILTSVLKNELGEELDWFNTINISFESRQKSKKTVEALFQKKINNENNETNLKAAYDICHRALQNKTIEYDITLSEFSKYLYDYVKILRVILPEDIDLNHYFEIMNSRGEQLEKHEVLKAMLMGSFREDKERKAYEFCFNLIWESCENMERYVQYGFSTKQRHLIFGKEDWDELSVYSFDEIVQKITSIDDEILGYRTDQKSAKTIDEIINNSSVTDSFLAKDEFPERYNSVINFPNFLLHVLKIQTNSKDVSLDDKRLISAFEKFLKVDDHERIEFSKNFIFNLLKCKFLFDKYIIKREFTASTDRWSLKSLKYYKLAKSKKSSGKYVNTFGSDDNNLPEKENRRILMLLSMFHVSTPSLSYKYWLFAALRYVFYQEEIKGDEYLKYLEHVVKAFVYDRFLSYESIDYQDLILENLFPTNRLPENICKSRLSYHEIENNLVFNYIDYLLWTNFNTTDFKIKSFEFSFRSSIEHYYPQNPINKDIDKIDELDLHSFGNLCLIDHEKNSRLNNYSPKAKKEHYSKSDNIDSIKQYLMMDSKWGVWDTKAIKQHEDEMFKLLEHNLNSDFYWKTIKFSPAKIWYKRYKKENKQLLIRTLMCFGQVDVYANGWSLELERYSLYEWDQIEHSKAFKNYERFVEEKNPRSLEEIIEFNVFNNKDLREDSYRYVLVTRPYLLDYCAEGNFGWGDNGKNFLLIKSTKASKHNSCDAYSFCLSNEIKNIFKVESYIDYECLRFSLNEEEDKVVLGHFKWDAPCFLNIWNNNEGYICYEINIEKLHGNSKVIKNLKEKGWLYNENKMMYHSSKQFLTKLTLDIENNICMSLKSLMSILKKL